MNKSKRPLRIKLLLALLTFLILLVGFEIGLRLFWQPYFWHNYYTKSDVSHHRGRPNILTGQVLETGEWVEIRTNSIGMRDVEYGPKTEDVFRILVLGDSFTEAGTSPLPQTSTKLLEQRLNEKLANSNRRFQVINAGQVSYSPLLEYLLLKNELMGLQPDLVLLNLDMSDVQDDYFYTAIAEFDDNGDPLRVPDRPIPIYIERRVEPSPILKRLTKKYYLLKFIEQRFHFQTIRLAANVVPGKIENDRLGTTRDNVTHWEPYYQKTGSYLLKIDHYLRRRNIPFIVFIYPHGHQVSPREWDSGRRQLAFAPGQIYTGSFFPFLEHFCAENDLDCQPLLNGFRAYKGEDLLFLPHNGHFTKAGEKLMADLQYKVLTDSKHRHIME